MNVYAHQLLRACPRTIIPSRSLATVSLSRTWSAAQTKPSRASSLRMYSAKAEDGASSSKTEEANENNKTDGENAGDDLVSRLKAKEEELTDVTHRLRYAQADFLNLQRMAAREKEQTRDYAISKFAGDLVSTVDVLSLALKSVPAEALASSESAQLKQLYEGVELTHRTLLQTLGKFGVVAYDPTGEKFDPNVHEALYQAPIPGKEPGTILETQKLGYTIKGRTLRAAQVGVVQDSS